MACRVIWKFTSHRRYTPTTLCTCSAERKLRRPVKLTLSLTVRQGGILWHSNPNWHRVTPACAGRYKPAHFKQYKDALFLPHLLAKNSIQKNNITKTKQNYSHSLAVSVEPCERLCTPFITVNLCIFLTNNCIGFSLVMTILNATTVFCQYYLIMSSILFLARFFFYIVFQKHGWKNSHNKIIIVICCTTNSFANTK